MITLKARFSRLFASLKLGGIAIDSALQVGFMLRALLSRYHGVVQDFRLGRHSLASATLQSVVEQCLHTTKIPGKDQGARMANLLGSRQHTLLVHPATAPIRMNPSPRACLAITCLAGGQIARTAATDA
jgi:hypothetical protein